MRSETRDFGEMRNESRYCIIQYQPITVFRLDKSNIFESLNSYAQWWNWDGTMIKTRWHDGEITMMRWHDRENNIAFSLVCHRSFIISYHRIFAIVTSSFTIVSSRFHHRTFVVSPSYNRCFTIVQSLFHVRTIVFSPLHHRVFIDVHQRTIVRSPLYHRERDLVCFSVRLQVKSINFLHKRYYYY